VCLRRPRHGRCGTGGAIEADTGPIDILVNNDSPTRRSEFHEQPAADWQTVTRTNANGVFVIGPAVARRMVPRRRGRTINTCSMMTDPVRTGTSA
jgi:gluconate 5-dehydrogenase